VNILISPTAFKGTLAPSEATRIIDLVFQRSFPKARRVCLPLADGGDGTLDVLMSTLRGRLITTRVRGPLGQPVRAKWALCANRTAVIEMARASGIALLRGKNNTRAATSFGTGELIKAALAHRCRRVFIGVGGTATSDGGAGALRALGFRYYDASGRELDGSPNQMSRLARVDGRGLDPRLAKTEIVVMCDVTNPLLGPRGSARTFGPQKGATPRDVVFLEGVMRRWATHARFATAAKPGAGAAGALAFGLSGFLRARMVRGTPFVMKAVHWERAARRADIIISGEGRLDHTSFSGKVIGSIVKSPARKRRTKIFSLCGDSPLGRVYLRRHGISHIERLGKDGLRRPAAALKAAAARLCAFLSSSHLDIPA
jgi:glycerate kinase